MTEENIYTTEEIKETTEIEEKNVVEETNFNAESSEDGSVAENRVENEPIKTVYVKYIPYGFTPETYEERNQLKTAARTVGAAFLGMTSVVLLLNIVTIVLSYVLGPKYSNILFESAALHVQQVIFSILALTVTFAAIFKICSNRISDLISFKIPEKRLGLTLFLFGVGFCSFANIVSSMAGEIFSSFNIDYDVSMPDSPKGIFGFLLVLISTVAVPALAEEFACRGLVLGLLRKFGDGFAIICSAILFGAMHGNFEQMPFAILVGLILGFVTVKSGSIWIAVAIHAFNNGISVVAEYAFGSFTLQQQNVIIMLLFVIFMILGLVALLLNIKDSSELYKLEKSTTAATEKQKYKWFFTSVPIILFLIICVVESFSFFII